MSLSADTQEMKRRMLWLKNHSHITGKITEKKSQERITGKSQENKSQENHRKRITGNPHPPPRVPGGPPALG